MRKGEESEPKGRQTRVTVQRLQEFPGPQQGDELRRGARQQSAKRPVVGRRGAHMSRLPVLKLAWLLVASGQPDILFDDLARQIRQLIAPLKELLDPFFPICVWIHAFACTIVILCVCGWRRGKRGIVISGRGEIATGFRW